MMRLVTATRLYELRRRQASQAVGIEEALDISNIEAKVVEPLYLAYLATEREIQEVVKAQEDTP